MPAGIKTNKNTMTNSGRTENPKGNHCGATSRGALATKLKEIGRRIA